jgi:hypothetical protein
LFGFFLGLLGTSFGVWLAHLLDERRRRREDFNRFAATFTSKMLDELEGLYPTPITWKKNPLFNIDVFLRFKFTKLERAVYEFRRHLPEIEHRAFTKAWVAYYSEKGDEGYQCYNHYMAFGDNPNYKGNFKHNVDTLLSFAKPK